MSTVPLSHMEAEFKNLSNYPKQIRQRGLKFLLLILNNINSHPNIPKYRNLNAIKIRKVFNKCQPCINLLFLCGFQETDDKKPRMKFDYKLNHQKIRPLLNFIICYSKMDDEQKSEKKIIHGLSKNMSDIENPLHIYHQMQESNDVQSLKAIQFIQNIITRYTLSY